MFLMFWARNMLVQIIVETVQIIFLSTYMSATIKKYFNLNELNKIKVSNN